MIYWLIPIAAVFFLIAIVNLVRRRRLLERHALLWLLTFVVVAVSPAFVPFLDRLAHALGILYPPTLYLLVAIFFLMANGLRNTIQISRLSEQNRRLTQELALLRHETARLEKRGAPGDE